MDAETKAALLELKDEIIKAVTDIIQKENHALEKNMREVYGIRMNYMEKEQTRSFKHHEEHFSEFKIVHKRIDDLESRQSTDEGTAAGVDKAIADQMNKKVVFWTIFGVVIAGLAFLGGTFLGG